MGHDGRCAPRICESRAKADGVSAPLVRGSVDRLQGKVVLVTGSATGVGEGIARRAAAEGARVVTHGREEEADPRIGAHLTGDLEDPAVPARLVEEAVKAFGRLDGLVNNAGVSWRGGIESSVEHYDRIMAINARAPFLMAQSALPHLRGGAIVNIGSVQARRGGANMVPYAMSKAALANLTRTLAEPLAKEGVRINALNLGWTLTPNERRLLMDTNGWDEGWPEEMAARMPLGRLMSPEDVAATVCHLLSDEAAMVTGQVWDLDQRSHGG